MVDFLKRLIFSIKEYLILVLLLLISLFLISQNESQALQKVKSLSFINIAVTNSLLSNLNFFSSESDEIIELRKRNAELMLRVNLLRNFAQENYELEKMLGYTENPKSDLLASKIISKNFGNIVGNIIIEKGEKDSVKIGMPVINHFGLIGIIYKTSNDFSLVRTLRNAKLNIAVSTQRTGVQGILNWQADKLILKNIPATYDIEVGDRILTSDFSTLFPPSIPVGIVAKKENNISGLVSDIVVQPYVDFNKLQNVFINKVLISKELNNFELNLMTPQKK